MKDLSDRLAHLSPVKRALIALKAQPKLESNTTVKVEPIAIIGVGCRFPGAVGAAAFWKLLCDGVDAVTEVPAERWDSKAFYDTDPLMPGKTNTLWGGFLNDVDLFDPAFFGITPREATSMDPQQRLLLEVAWETLEDAGQQPHRLAGTRTGVFVGISSNDYCRIVLSSPNRIGPYAGTGNVLCIAANRISYMFDLRGPSLAVDTACSASLYATYLACQSIWSGESSFALAGGVNLILSPAATINFSKAGVMAPDGRCKAFDSRANGYVRSEGVGLVALKPLTQAIADNNQIYAVIRGGAVTHDGRTNGLMAPNRLSQEVVLQEAYRKAGVSPGQIQYVEAHGTGTLLGDPIEAMALGKILAIDRAPEDYCMLGSVKTNIGHAESAAGIAGLIKVALALKHGMIPPSLHFDRPNPNIPFGDLPLRVQTVLSPWPRHSGPLLAGVSSFGFGGANAHIVLEEAPKASRTETEISSDGRPCLLTISAKNEKGLLNFASSYKRFLSADTTASSSLRDICYTAAMRRTHHDFRLAVVGDSNEEFTEKLDLFCQGTKQSGVSSGRDPLNQRFRPVFVFPGQGSQWVGMARDLLGSDGPFLESLRQCDLAMREHLDWSVIELLSAEGSLTRFEEIDVIQPLLFAIQVGLAALWRSIGVQPEAVVGHSMGEVAAAFVAGALSLEDAVRVICVRSRLLRRISKLGAMAAVELSLDQTRQFLSDYEDVLSIAVSNGPESTVISGDAIALSELVQRLEQQSLFCRQIKADVASHSPQVESLLGDLAQLLSNLRPLPARIPFYSTVTGRLVKEPYLDAAYWCRNLRQTVLFYPSVQELLGAGHNVFLELSPHPALIVPVEQTLHELGLDATVLPSMRRGERTMTAMLHAMGALFSRGHISDFGPLYPDGGRSVSLPTYPWQRERFWVESESQQSGSDWEETGQAPEIAAKGLFGGRYTQLANQRGNHLWEIELNRHTFPYIDDYRMHEISVLPHSCYVELALAFASRVLNAEISILRELKFHRPLCFIGAERRVVQVIITESEGSAAFEIYSQLAGPCKTGNPQSGNPWILHATGGIVERESAHPSIGHDSTSDGSYGLELRDGSPIPGEEYYRHLGTQSLDLGKSFHGIQSLWFDSSGSLAHVSVAEVPESERIDYHIHPVILDCSWQVLQANLPAATEDKVDALFLPASIDEIRLHFRPGRSTWSQARKTSAESEDEDSLTGNVTMFDEEGKLLVETIGLRLHRINLREYLPDRSSIAILKNQTTNESPMSREILLALPADERHQMLEPFLQQQIARVLGLPSSKLDCHIPLTAAGLDSILAMHLKNRIESGFGVTLSIAEFVQGPTVTQLTAQIIERLTHPDWDSEQIISIAASAYNGNSSGNGNGIDSYNGHHTNGADDVDAIPVSAIEGDRELWDI